MIGENIICFAKDWYEDPTSNNHVILELAKNNRVLWLNSVSMRIPSLRSTRDLWKIGRKIVEFSRGVNQVRPNLYVYTPLVLPFPYSEVSAVINRWILKLTLIYLRRRLGMRDFQLWTFLPNVANYVGHLGESMVVYYCVDEWSEISYLDGKKMADAEESLCRQADLVFVTAHSLLEKRRAFNAETHLSLHGVDYELFATALNESLAVPQELAVVPRPIIGFYGLVHDWIDLDLFVYLAERHPEWSLVIIGDHQVNVSRLVGYPNVYLLGRKPYNELPRYCKAFAVGFIPFRVSRLSPYINPIKLREYLSAGLPVVSTDLPEVRRYSTLCVIGKSYEEIEHGIGECIVKDSAEARRKRSEAMQSETWAQKVFLIAAHVKRIKDKCKGE